MNGCLLVLIRCVKGGIRSGFLVEILLSKQNSPRLDATSYEPRREKTGLRGFQPGLTQTDMYSPRSSIEARNFGFNKKRKCTIRVAKTKALISFAVTAKLICAFVLLGKNPVFSRCGSYDLTSGAKLFAIQ